MSINLLDLVKDQLSDAVIGKAAGLIGESSGATSSALSTILPTILGSVVQKGATQSGASGIMDMINSGGHDGSMFDNLSGLLGGGSQSNTMLKSGAALVASLMGAKQGGIVDTLMSLTGMKKSSTNSLMSMVAPMVMGMIGRQIKKNGLNVGGLMDLLKGQKSHLKGALPSSLGSMMGFSEGNTSRKSTASTSHVPETSGGGGGWMKWLLGGLALLFVLGYFGMKTGCGAVDNMSDKVADTTTGAVEATADAAKSMAGATVDAAGNLVDESGNVLKKAGEFTKDAAGNVVDAAGNAVNSAAGAVSNAVNYTVDAAGNLVDESGKVIKKAGEFTRDAAGNVVDAAGSAVGAAGAAAGNVAEKAGEMAELGVSKATYTVSEAGDLVDEGGKVILKAGEFETKDGYYVDKNGKKIGVFKKIGQAIGSAAKKTAETFDNMFSGMFKKKQVGEAYTLNNISFNPENHKITNFSKAEIEGLAAALKSNPDSKITVNAYTADGENEVKNKALSKLRAKVVHDMLVTLGVPDKQISAKGLATKDAGKAAANNVEITIAE